MSRPSRREFVGGAAALATLHPAIARALAIPAHRRSGTLRDVEHVVVLMQENRSFDHYFGAMSGVRGFGDPFPIPVADREGRRAKTVWIQPPEQPTPGRAAIAPFHLNTTQRFEYIRVEGTPHSWRDAQAAWDHGRMGGWPLAKRDHALGYYKEADVPFQWALASAFTICDAYHCSIHAGTNPNRLFHWTGTNDPSGQGNGPATYNDYDSFDADPGRDGGYAWATYPERLEQAGVSWQVYEDMEDNFGDNPLAGFHAFRDAWFARPGHSQALKARGVSTRDLDLLKEDVLAGRLPSVSWIVGTAEGSEHPGPSSPAQGADYIARVLEALTSNPEVWSRTVLLVNFDENDGFFDHMPPPAPPSRDAAGGLAGASTVETTGEYHERLVPYHADAAERALLGRPYGLGPRVPLYVVSPWSVGGWVSSEVSDHTSVIRFIEARFGVREPNISPWRRAVCGDLTGTLDFTRPEPSRVSLPHTTAGAERARALPGRTTPALPETIELPIQEEGVRKSRALPYELHVTGQVREAALEIVFASTGDAAAVFHVYDRLRLESLPRRYTVEPAKSLTDVWAPRDDGSYDVWVLGPNGFHRHFRGLVGETPGEAAVAYRRNTGDIALTLSNAGATAARFMIGDERYLVEAGASRVVVPPLPAAPWYDVTVGVEDAPSFSRRFAGRVETGRPSISDPAMRGAALARA